MNFLIILGFISLIVFIIPFLLKNSKKYLIIYIWISFSFLLFLWGQNYYWEYTHPTADQGVGAALGYFIFFVITLAIIIPIIIITIWKNLFILVFKRFIIPLIIIFIPIYILFQGYLLLSAYKSYSSAKQMLAKNIDTQDMYDFYSPSIKHIQIAAGNPERYYRWSYRRSRYVFEINQNNIIDKNETSINLSFWHMPYNQYIKNYHFSIPKTYIEKDSYYALSQIIIPSNIPLSNYFNFNNKCINIRSSKSTSIHSSMDKKLGNQYGLQKGIDDGYYHDDNRKKYGNNYLTYSNKTVLIQCLYLEKNITSDTCHMNMLSNGFEYKFNIYKKYIPQWKQIKTKLSELFESFIVDTKRYPETLNPYKE